MPRFFPIDDSAPPSAVAELADLLPATVDDIARSKPDQRWGAGRSGIVDGHCSLWWNDVPKLAGERLGVIGHYAARDDACASLLLENACDKLRQRGCTLAVGPMDGNTW